MSQLAGYNTQQNVAVLTAGSVAGGTALLPILIAPFGGMTITSAKLSAQTAVNAGTVNYATFTLINGGTLGTATTAIGTAGGTAGVTVAPAAFTLNTSADELTAGQYLLAKVAETGSVVDTQFSVIIEWVRGQG